MLAAVLKIPALISGALIILLPHIGVAKNLGLIKTILRSCVCILKLPDCLHVGNKCDMEPERQVPFEEACDLAKDRDILAALETSAKVMSALLLFASFKNAMELAGI